jgi:coenzyme A diphosphatase NUDT7
MITSNDDMDQLVKPVAEKSIEELRSIFKPFDILHNPEIFKLQYPEGIFRKASVLMPLCFKNGEYHIILTLRSKDLTHHAGYVAFPGGMQDDTDKDEIATALREAEEEIGLDPKCVEIIGLFSPGLVRPNSIVYPVLGIVPSDFTPVINEKEVSLVFELPLRRFLSSERRRISDFLSSTNATYHVYHFIDHVKGEEVDTWGFTASFCCMTALGVYQSEHTFSFYEHFNINKNNIFVPTATELVVKEVLKQTSKY